MGFYDVIIPSPAGKASAKQVRRNKDEPLKGDIPMKKILIALTAVGMFAAFSGIATAGEEAPAKAEKTEKAGGKTKGKKSDKAAAGDTAAPAGEKAPDATKK
jgi:hypothetical protein